MARFNEYEFNKLRAKRHAEKVRQKQEIYEIRHKNDSAKNKIPFSKIAILFIFVDCLCIQIFIMRMIYLSMDTSHLSSLVGLVGSLAGQVIALCSYNRKAQAENSANGIVYETAMLEMMNNRQENDIMNADDEDAVG